MIKKYFQLIGILAFMMFAVFSIADIAREDRDFYTQNWGAMSIQQIKNAINADMTELKKDMDVEIIENTPQFGMVFSFRWLKGQCDGDNCYLQNRAWRAVYGVDLVGYIVSQGNYKDVQGCVGFVYEDYEDLVLIIVPFEFCREANKQALLCNTVEKNVDYMLWLYDQIWQFSTGEEQYLNQATPNAPKKGIII